MTKILGNEESFFSDGKASDVELVTLEVVDIELLVDVYYLLNSIHLRLL